MSLEIKIAGDPERPDRPVLANATKVIANGVDVSRFVSKATVMLEPSDIARAVLYVYPTDIATEITSPHGVEVRCSACSEPHECAAMVPPGLRRDVTV